MRSPSRRISFAFTVIFFKLFLFLGFGIATGAEFVPPVPDKSKTLPANDGGPDGCSSSRFDCVLGGEAVLDKATGLVWARNIKYEQKAVSWADAAKFCQDVEIAGKTGWRLPTRDELISVLDTSQSFPALPEGNPFIVSGAEKHGGTGHDGYWTSTDFENNKESAWLIAINRGIVWDSLKIFDSKVWPVRDSE